MAESTGQGSSGTGNTFLIDNCIAKWAHSANVGGTAGDFSSLKNSFVFEGLFNLNGGWI